MQRLLLNVIPGAAAQNLEGVLTHDVDWKAGPTWDGNYKPAIETAITLFNQGPSADNLQRVKAAINKGEEYVKQKHEKFYILNGQRSHTEEKKKFIIESRKKAVSFEFQILENECAAANSKYSSDRSFENLEEYRQAKQALQNFYNSSTAVFTQLDESALNNGIIPAVNQGNSAILAEQFALEQKKSKASLISYQARMQDQQQRFDAVEREYNSQHSIVNQASAATQHAKHTITTCCSSLFKKCFGKGENEEEQQPAPRSYQRFRDSSINS